MGRLAAAMLLRFVRGERPGIGGEGLPYRAAPAMMMLTPENISAYPIEKLFGPTDYEPKIVQ